jgi:hypothetical protein
MDEIIKYAVVAALLSFMCATLLAASAAQAGPDWHLYHGYYNYAPGYMANPALGARWYASRKRPHRCVAPK